jgi:hypothetical protein
LLDDGDGVVLYRTDAEEELKLRVVLTAEAGEILVGIGVETADGLDVADGGSEGNGRPGEPAPEEAPRAEDADRVVEVRKGRYNEDCAGDRP